MLQTGAVSAVLAAGCDGTVHSSYPLADDGNYTFWAYSDAYKAPVTKEDGSEVDEDIYEAYNLGLVRTRSRTSWTERTRHPCRCWPRLQVASERKAEIPPGHGVRVNGTKYMIVQDLSSAVGAVGCPCRPVQGDYLPRVQSKRTPRRLRIPRAASTPTPSRSTRSTCARARARVRRACNRVPT